MYYKVACASWTGVLGCRRLGYILHIHFVLHGTGVNTHARPLLVPREATDKEQPPSSCCWAFMASCTITSAPWSQSSFQISVSEKVTHLHAAASPVLTVAKRGGNHDGKPEVVVKVTKRNIGNSGNMALLKAAARDA